jgi:hypothetical protein
MTGLTRFRPMAAAFLLSGLIAGHAEAGISVTNNTNASALQTALLGGGTGGIHVTNFALSYQDNGAGAQSTGIYTATGYNGYLIPAGQGIVLSTGNAADASSGPVVQSITTNYNTTGLLSGPQYDLLNPIAPTTNGFFDVTQLTITFTAGPNTTQVFFSGVFASAEYPVFVGQYNDAFGLFLNGTNIATAGGYPISIDSPYMAATTTFPTDPTTTFYGNPVVVKPQYQTTALQSVLVPSGGPNMTFSGAVTPGSTNTLTFIIADNNDGNLDSAFYVRGLGSSPPTPPLDLVPEPSTLVILAVSGPLIAVWACGRRRTRKAGA